MSPSLIDVDVGKSVLVQLIKEAQEFVRGVINLTKGGCNAFKYLSCFIKKLICKSIFSIKGCQTVAYR